MYILFKLKNKNFCLNNNQNEFISPYFFKNLGENITINGFELNDSGFKSITLELTCVQIFKDEKKIHFRKGPKNEKDKTKGFRELKNLVKIVNIN